jgi:hypothetical protein
VVLLSELISGCVAREVGERVDKLGSVSGGVGVQNGEEMASVAEVIGE